MIERAEFSFEDYPKQVKEQMGARQAAPPDAA
jgi:hypothetical protein